MTDQKSARERHEEFTRRYYETARRDGGSVRSGHSDAATMCDAIANDILDAAPKRKGPKRREAEACAAAVKAAGDAIWAMREKIRP